MEQRIELTTDDGWTLVGDLHLPNREPWGVALLGHAMMVDRRTLDRPRGLGLASVLASRGMAVLNLDFRGHGESQRPSSPSFGFDDVVRYDVPALLGALRKRFPTLPRFLVGHSLGVNAGLPGAARMGDHGLSGAVALAPNLWTKRFEPSPIRRLGKEAMLRAFDLGSRPTGFFDPAPFGLGRSRIPRAYIEQFLSFWSSDRLVSADGRDDYERMLASLTMPILAVSGGRDAILAHPDSVERYLALFRRAPVRHVRWRGSRGFEPDHMGLVMAEESRPLFHEVADFMEAIAKARKVAS